MSPEAVRMVVYSGGSGIGHYSHSLCRELARQGVPVELLTNQAFPFDGEGENYRVRRLFRRLRWYPVDLVRLLAALLSKRKGLVHFQSYLHYPLAECLLVALLRLSGTNTVLTVHDLLPFNPRRYHKPLFRTFYRLFDRLIVHSAEARRQLGEGFGIADGRVGVIPHGLYDIFLPPEAVTREKAREELGLHPDETVFIFFGHLTERKGVEDLVDAFGLIHDRHRRARLIIAGKPGGGFDRVIADRVEKYGILTDYAYLPVERVALYFAAADVAVLPYRESTTSGVLKIAMAFDLPVIATSLGEIPEFVRDGCNGFLVSPRNVDALAGRLEKFVGEPALIGEMRRNCAAFVKEELGWSRIADKTARVYRGLSEGG